MNTFTAAAIVASFSLSHVLVHRSSAPDGVVSLGWMKDHRSFFAISDFSIGPGLAVLDRLSR